MIKCSNCGTDAPESARSCAVCATPLPRPSVATAVLTPPGRSTAGPSTAADAETIASPFVNPFTTGGAAVSLVPGQTFGHRYQVISLLGVGGMGAVYHVWDSELGLSLALKVIRPEPDPAAAQELERRFKRELVLARQVTHTNVIRIHDLGEIDGIKYITMPFVHGTDLARLLAARRQAAGRPRAAARAADRVGTARRARGRHRPPRSQARQHPDRRLREGDHHRLRHRALDRSGHVRDGGRRDHRHDRVHGARAGDGQARRSARRHLRVRPDSLRDARREARIERRRYRARAAHRARQPRASRVCARSIRRFPSRSTRSSPGVSSRIRPRDIRRRRSSRRRSIVSMPNGHEKSRRSSNRREPLRSGSVPAAALALVAALSVGVWMFLAARPRARRPAPAAARGAGLGADRRLRQSGQAIRSSPDRSSRR